MGDIRVFMNSLPGGLNFRHEVCMHYIVSHLSVCKVQIINHVSES